MINDAAINNLAIAAVQQAVYDWRYLCKGGSETRWRNFKELEHFFRNDCELLLVGISISHTMLLEQMLQEKTDALSAMKTCDFFAT